MEHDAGRSTSSASEQPQYFSGGSAYGDLYPQASEQPEYFSGGSAYNDLYPHRSAAQLLLDRARFHDDKLYSSHIASKFPVKGVPIHNVVAGPLHRAETSLSTQGVSICTDKRSCLEHFTAADPKGKLTNNAVCEEFVLPEDS